MKNQALKKLDKLIADTRKETRSLHIPKQKDERTRYLVTCSLKHGNYSYFNEYMTKAKSRREAKRNFKAHIKPRLSKNYRIVPFSLQATEYEL